MALVTSRPVGAPCWLDLATADLAAAQHFYGGLFGWRFEDTGEQFGHYRRIHAGDHVVAGAQLRDPDQPEAWTVYLQVPDAGAAAVAITAAGGRILVPPRAVGPLGSMLLALEPGGAAVGAWQPAGFAGFDVLGEPGAPVWFESLSKAYDASVAFYRNAFGWPTVTMSDTPQFRYTTYGTGEAARGGIMDARDFLGEAPATWQVYLGSDDVDAAQARVPGLGGTVLTEAQDSPYGRLARFADPGGAAFGVMSAGG